MPLLVSSNAAALQAAPPANASGNSSSAGAQQSTEKFGQVLNRSLASSAPSPENPADATKLADRGIARRHADAASDSEQQQDSGAAPALAFMPLPQIAVNAIQAKTQLSGDSQQPSAAENQLNAAIAAASGKTGALAPVAQSPAEGFDKGSDKSAGMTGTELSPATRLATQLTTQSGPAATASSPRNASASREFSHENTTTVTHNQMQLITQTAAGDAAGQKTAHDDGLSDKHEKLEKMARQDNRTNTEFSARHADAVASNAAGNDTAIARTGANNGSNGSPLNADLASQVNPAVANSHAGSAAAAAASDPAPVKLALTPLVGSEDWGPALGKHVAWMGSTSNQTAELHLNPPDLGPLKITLSISDNQAQAMFVSAHQSVRSALEAALPQLRSSLADSGINLGNTSVSPDTQQQQQSAFTQNQGGQQSQNGQFQHSIGVSGISPSAERSVAPVSKRSDGKVDIFA